LTTYIATSVNKLKIFVIALTTTLTLGWSKISNAQDSQDPRFNSTYLIEAGDRAKAYWYKAVFTRNQSLPTGLEYIVTDARDPRLYPPGAPIQPPTPADNALVKVASNGNFLITALIIDRPGVLEIKEFPTGNRVIDIYYDVRKLTYSSRFDGLFASITRFTAGYGWDYQLYLRGYGNQINSVFFDNSVASFLQRSAAYVTP
jgi:hypothetical protein